MTRITDARTVITISASPHNLAPVTPARSFRTDCAFCRRPALAFRRPSSNLTPAPPLPSRATRARSRKSTRENAAMAGTFRPSPATESVDRVEQILALFRLRGRTGSSLEGFDGAETADDVKGI